MNRKILQAAVIGSGVMGSRIACHFANVGIPVLLLDIVPSKLSDTEERSGLTLESTNVRNRIVNDALQAAIKSSPSPLYDAKSVGLIQTGNLEDDFHRLAAADWIVEVVVERLDIKRQLFERIEGVRKAGSLVTSNTSGIPLHLMAEGRSADFTAHFCGTHFFNPPRYLRLLEIIPQPAVKQEVVDFLMDFGDRILGKTTVLCKDTPAFIANRIGVYGIMALFHSMERHNLSIDDVDKLTGPLIGRPKSATFRTCDVVGLDTLVHVAKGVAANCPADESSAAFAIPNFIEQMVKNNWLGSKTGQGFYKKEKVAGKKDQILSLNLSTLEYGPAVKQRFPVLETTKNLDKLSDRLKALVSAKDPAGAFVREMFAGLFHYVGHRIPEIADDVYKIDEAMKAGFGWELGPFEYWDALGFETGMALIQEAKLEPAAWIVAMKSQASPRFYTHQQGRKQHYRPSTSTFEPIPGTEHFLLLDSFRAQTPIWKNAGCTLHDIGDGILNLEFHTKMNTIGGEIISGLNKSIQIAEESFNGLVISNEAPNFTAGANLGMIFMMAAEGEWDELNMAIRAFQQAMMRVRYSAVPVVVAPHNMTLGGGCEMSLHADRVQAHAELYMGLVEFGVGVIPGGGGTKEFALRASDAYFEGDLELATLRNRFLTIGQAKVSTSAQEAFKLGYLRPGTDGITLNRNRLLADAKNACLDLSEKGYKQPVKRKDVKVLGRSGLGMIYAGANSMYSGNFISEHDRKISEKLGYVMCGGDLSMPQLVSEDYLLDLEREAFLSLCGERKTQERMQSILTGGKVLRN